MRNGLYNNIEPENDDNDENKWRRKRTQKNKHLMALRRIRRRKKPGDITGGGAWKRKK